MKESPKFWTPTEYDCIRIDFDGLNGCILFGKDSEEHARLIAAAPELLAACKAIIENEPKGITPYFDEAIELAEQAIDKATQ